MRRERGGVVIRMPALVSMGEHGVCVTAPKLLNQPLNESRKLERSALVLKLERHEFHLRFAGPQRGFKLVAARAGICGCAFKPMRSSIGCIPGSPIRHQNNAGTAHPAQLRAAADRFVIGMRNNDAHAMRSKRLAACEKVENGTE